MFIQRTVQLLPAIGTQKAKLLLYVFACNERVQLKPKHSVQMHRRLQLKNAGGKIATILRWCTVARARDRFRIQQESIRVARHEAEKASANLCM